ncbi:MAG TPA: class I SAM-dependent methyltransferase [Candidatus Udaeobacter sp.]|jgi:SAM-dependent methyltransferase|nr:class I SAM-dependent methyltransferase [Candidatus Udaeobacter sp.]
MQSNAGLLRWLKAPLFYNLFQGVVGGNALRRRIIQNNARARPGDKVIDIGCGPAQALESLPDVEYLGLDINPDYIAFAKGMYGNKGTFVVGDTRSLRSDPRFKNADIVIAVSVLHHLDDEEAMDCIRFAYDALKKGGRLICHEACWIPNQGVFSKCIMSHDRGRNIRTEQQYRQLAAKLFRNVRSWIDTRPMRIPYVTIVLECEK